MAEEKKVITIDNVDYTEDQLDGKQKMMVNHINSLQQKISNTERFGAQVVLYGKSNLSFKKFLSL